MLMPGSTAISNRNSMCFKDGGADIQTERIEHDQVEN
jgi:hypothetical protein